MKKATGFLIVCSILIFSGCATLQEMAALRKVDFDLDRVSDPVLAGVALKDIKSYQDIGFVEAGRLALALASKELPLSFVVHVRAENPADNSVPARFLGMDWTLFLQDKETVRGVLDQRVVLQPGVPQDVPVAVALNLMDFYEGGIRDLVNLASSLTGADGSPVDVRLEVVPTIETSIGPIRYPQPISVVQRRIGQ